MKGIVEAHGGTVEKFIGDAVMAVFGVPTRARGRCPTCLPRRGRDARRLPELGIAAGSASTPARSSPEPRSGSRPAMRSTSPRGWSRPPLRARSWSAPRRLRSSTARSLRSRVAPLDAEGKGKPVARIPAALGHTASRRPQPRDADGRSRDASSALRDAFAQAVHDRSCQLFTVLGSAGVGKSRLAAEFLDAIDARVVRGRCLSYGEGITYWPVVEIIKQLDALPARPLQPRSIRSLLGEADAATSAEEIAWALPQAARGAGARAADRLRARRPALGGGDFARPRRARRRPLPRRAHPAPLHGPARSCSSSRPAWGGGKLNSTTVLLEPLDAAETERLLDRARRRRIRVCASGSPRRRRKPAVRRGDARARARVGRRRDQRAADDPGAAGGPPRPARPGGAGGARARLCRGPGLPPGAVQALRRRRAAGAEAGWRSSARSSSGPRRPQFAGEDAFRFRHLLIRDAAYDALPKASPRRPARALRRLARRARRDLVELDEILGYHLEQAARYKAGARSAGHALAERAAERLAAAGRRAYSARRRTGSRLSARARAGVDPATRFDVGSGARPRRGARAPTRDMRP